MSYANRIVNSFYIIIVITFLSFNIAAANEIYISPEVIDGVITVDVDQAKELFNKKTIFIDVRKDSDWNAGRIPGAVHLDIKKKFTEVTLSEVVDKSSGVVFYCNGVECSRSYDASKKAVNWGYKNVYFFRLGFPAWKRGRHPVE